MLDNFREWLSDNLRYILLGLAVILVVIIGICIFRLIGGSGSSSGKKESGKQTTPATSAPADSDSQEESKTVSLSAPSAGESLTQNEEDLLALCQKYYKAVSAEDEQTLATIVEPWNDKVKEETFSLNDKFRSFDNITTYSKAGPVDDSWIVYVYSECRVDGVDRGVPTLLLPQIVITTDSSDKKISSDRDQYASFIEESNTSSDVQQLIDEVNRQYEELKGSDDQVKNYSSDDTSSGGEASTEAAGGNAATSYGTATATDNVNIRSEGSTNGAVLGTLYPGQEVSIVSTEGDWTHITFTDPSTGSTVEGYVSNSYLNIG